MDALIDQILALQKVSESLEPSKDDRNKMHDEIQYFANNFIRNLDSYPAFDQRDANRENLKLKAVKSDLLSILQKFNTEVVLKGIKPASGGHVGYISGGGIYSAALGDFLASVTNEYAGIYYASPGAVTMEEELLDWMKQLFGFPKDAVGNLTSGGSIANMIALTATIDNAIKMIHNCLIKTKQELGILKE
jgi:glutamate/tyrosine decarboxylase-like PLP-dependent enzyme